MKTVNNNYWYVGNYYIPIILLHTEYWYIEYIKIIRRYVNVSKK